MSIWCRTIQLIEPRRTRTTFDRPATKAIMNDYFVILKYDREEDVWATEAMPATSSSEARMQRL
jgi:hypothetical protein